MDGRNAEAVKLGRKEKLGFIPKSEIYNFVVGWNSQAGL